MVKKDARVDAYIAKAAPFAKPILTHIRKLVHQACPEVEETIKWSFPNFDYKGVFCSMAAFKEHCSFGFWKAALMKDSVAMKDNQKNAMGHMGKITSLAALPPDKVLLNYIKEAAKLNDEGIKLPPRKKTEKPELQTPDYFEAMLKKNKKAMTTFNALSPSHKREYIAWITEGKSEETRNRRMLKAIEYLTDGKGLNWKYERQ
ncbi:MAG: YdeI/OmpD-associated family protein [Chitinophagaceae bacterium]|nr:YdeI/OmpD-associated family protein [Chitinophagaceae bacterium]